MANEFVAKNGLISQNNTTVSGSLTVTQGITGSLLGTASNAIYAENGSETLQEIINNSVVSNEIVGTVASNDFFTIRNTDVDTGLYIYGNDMGGASVAKSTWLGRYGTLNSKPDIAIGIDDQAYNGIAIRGTPFVSSSNFILGYSGDSTEGGITYISASRITFPYTGNAVITGSLIVSGSSGGFGGITGSLEGTASYALTASYAMNGGGTPINTSSFATTGSNTFNGSQIITGSLAVGTSSLGPNENTLTLGARDVANEGGQLGFNAPGGTYTSASFFDLYQNRFRLLRGTNAGSTGEVATWNLGTLQMQLPAYTSATSFPGTSVASLAVDSGGNILTQPVPSPVYSIFFFSNAWTITAGQTYYIANYPRNPATTVNTSRVGIPKAGTITDALFTIYSQGVIGSNNGITASIRLNNTTDYLIEQNATANTFRTFTNNSLNIPVSVGDTIELKLQIATPYTTVPTNNFPTANVLIKT
jgi:hypothetical protein